MIVSQAEAEQLRRLLEFGKQKNQLYDEMREFSEDQKRCPPPAFVTQWVSRYGPPESLRPMLYHACLRVGDFAYVDSPSDPSASGVFSPTPADRSAAPSPTPNSGPGPGLGPGRQPSSHSLSTGISRKKLEKKTMHLRRSRKMHDQQVALFEHYWREGVAQLSLTTLEQIDKDINRAFRDHEKFADRYGEGYVHM